MKNLKANLKLVRQGILVVTCVGLVATGARELTKAVLAEQSGNSPESNATSRIKTAYDWLVAKGANYGVTDAGDWTNSWGTYWNRIMESAAWEPDGTATAGDVVDGKTFYAGNGDRTQKEGTLALTGNATTSQVADGATFYSDSFTKLEGTASLAPDYSTQSLATKDDYLGTYKGEETTWTEVTGSPFSGYGDLNLATGKVKKDSLTGLWWSASSTTLPSNSFTLSADGARPAGGNAIAFCDALNTASYGGHADWYLPTQKELIQAYIDGIYSQDADFATTSYFWSSTEDSGRSSSAWYVVLPYGGTGGVGKSGEGFLAVRCVRRDL